MWSSPKAIWETPQNMWKKLPWADETEMERFGHKRTCYVWRKPSTSHHLREHHPHGEARWWWWSGGSIMLWGVGVFRPHRPGNCSELKAWMEGAKGNSSGEPVSVFQRFRSGTVQAAIATLERSKRKHSSVLEGAYPSENLWHDLKTHHTLTHT